MRTLPNRYAGARHRHGGAGLAEHGCVYRSPKPVTARVIDRAQRFRIAIRQLLLQTPTAAGAVRHVAVRTVRRGVAHHGRTFMVTSPSAFLKPERAQANEEGFALCALVDNRRAFVVIVPVESTAARPSAWLFGMRLKPWRGISPALRADPH